MWTSRTRLENRSTGQQRLLPSNKQLHNTEQNPVITSKMKDHTGLYKEALTDDYLRDEDMKPSASKQWD